MQKKKIDIVVPFYNTREHIWIQFKQNVNKLINDNHIDFRIILVNDGSNSEEYIVHCEEYKVAFRDNIILVNLSENKGKGGAIKEGMRHTTADLVVFYDIDFPFGIKSLYEMCDVLQEESTSVVIAKRDDSYNKKLPFKRKIISQVVKKLTFLLSKGKIKDSQAGLKGMKRQVVPILLSTESNSFIMDFEFLLKVSHKKLSIKEIIVTPNQNIEFTNFSNATLFKEIKNLFNIIVKYVL